MRTRHSSIRILAAIFVSAVGASAYELNGPKWGTHQVPYYVNPVNSDMSEDAAVAAIQAGVMAWSAQSNANILPYYMGRTTGSTVSLNGRSEIFFRDVSAGGMYGDTTWWYDSSYRLIEADIVFYDGGVTFFSSSGGCSGGVYLEDATTHEFGHALGLGHSSDPGASMYHTMQWCSSDFRTLDSDDLAGIEALYPSVGSSNATPIVTVTAPTIDAFTEGTSVTFAGSSSDKEDGDISDRLVWMSSIDGQIGTGSSFARALSLGSHLVTASASDSGGLTATKEIIVTVTSSEPFRAGPSLLDFAIRQGL